MMPRIERLMLRAEQGDVISQRDLGLAYYDGDCVPKSFKNSVKWYTLSASKGDVQSQYVLGCMYFAGDGVPKSNKIAEIWFRLAAEQEDADAQYNLGLMYINGDLKGNDGRKWLQRSADNGSRNAQKCVDALIQNDEENLREGG